MEIMHGIAGCLQVLTFNSNSTKIVNSAGTLRGKTIILDAGHGGHGP
ncbi:hypothetical protein KHA93_13540 [Bacillus sp. FJAT-49732]|uniref:N-acetylmuramoyl-L-alanine amidase n=1 Tax=Lederbergia citrisecunda TaxID=2833583 RepID=A0A942TPT1_9BACI|nr:hypothetical protein [Lederbergia citrisecunda]MBS4200656.1 hypothetical protein [Lederbergia citrisecunda]